MSIVETFQRAHIERRQRFAQAAMRHLEKGTVPVPVVEAIAAPKLPRVRRRVFDPADERAWMIEIEGLVPKPPISMSIKKLQWMLCEHYGITYAEMVSPSRFARLAEARQVGAYLARKLVGKSFPEIGRAFGGRDHTTQIYAVHKVTALIQTDERTRASVEMLTEKFMGPE